MKINNADHGQWSTPTINQDNNVNQTTSSKLSFRGFKKGAIKVLRTVKKHIPIFRSNNGKPIETPIHARTVSTSPYNTQKEPYSQTSEHIKSNSSTVSSEEDTNNRVENWLKKEKDKSKQSVKTFKEIEEGLKTGGIASKTKLNIPESEWQSLLDNLALEELKELVTNVNKKHGMLAHDKGYDDKIRMPAVATFAKVEASRINAHHNDKNLEDHMGIVEINGYYDRDTQIIKSIEDELTKTLNPEKNTPESSEPNKPTPPKVNNPIAKKGKDSLNQQAWYATVESSIQENNTPPPLEPNNTEIEMAMMAKYNASGSNERRELIEKWLADDSIASKEELKIPMHEWKDMLSKLDADELAYLAVDGPDCSLGLNKGYSDDIRKPALEAFAEFVCPNIIQIKGGNLEDSIDFVRNAKEFSDDLLILEVMKKEFEKYFKQTEPNNTEIEIESTAETKASESKRNLKLIEKGIENGTIASKEKLNIPMEQWKRMLSEVDINDLQFLVYDSPSSVLGPERGYSDHIRRPALEAIAEWDFLKLVRMNKYSRERLMEFLDYQPIYAKDKIFTEILKEKSDKYFKQDEPSNAKIEMATMSENNASESKEMFKRIEKGLEEGTIASKEKLKIPMEEWKGMLSKLNHYNLTQLCLSEVTEIAPLGHKMGHSDYIREPALEAFAEFDCPKIINLEQGNRERFMNILQTQRPYSKDKLLVEVMKKKFENYSNQQ